MDIKEYGGGARFMGSPEVTWKTSMWGGKTEHMNFIAEQRLGHAKKEKYVAQYSRVFKRVFNLFNGLWKAYSISQ